MNEPNPVLIDHPAEKATSRTSFFRRLPGGFAVSLLLLLVAFSTTLWDLTRFALQSELYSYILLIPCISLYLLWIRRTSLPPVAPPDRTSALLGWGAGAGVLLAYSLVRLGGVQLPQEDLLAFRILSFVLLLGGTCAWFLGRQLVRSILFPLGFLLFMAPIPVAALEWIETFMQHGSAAAAHLLFSAAGTTVYFQDLTFQLPGIALHVARECSGIRSSLVLFIVSLVAGYFFLRSPMNRALLTLAVVPLALVRNGFRIFTIGELCLRIGPEMADSFIHHRGGPIFFALSLVPFFLLLVILMKRERRTRQRPRQVLTANPR